MRKISIFIITFLVIAKFSIGQTYTWKGSVSTDYQVAANWAPARTTPSVTDILAFNATSPITVTNVANQSIGAIQIATGTSSVIFSTYVPTNTLTLRAAIPLIYTSAGRILAGDLLTIAVSNPSPFTISAGVFGIAAGEGGKIRIGGALTLAGGTLDVDEPATGGTTIDGPAGSITYISGTFLSARSSSITWTTGANYYHRATGAGASAIPASTWLSGSTCNITGMNAGTIAPTGLTGINFANLTWDCPSQTSNVNLLPTGAVVNINGTFSVVSTGVGAAKLQLSLGKATIKAGAYLQTGGNITLQAGADTTTFNISGNFSHTAGVLDGVGGSLPGMAVIDLKGNVTRGAAAFWQSSGTNTGSQIIYQFSGTTVQAVNVTAGTWNPPGAGRCNIVNNNKDINSGINLTGMLRVYNTNSALLPGTLAMNGVITGSGGVSYTGAGAGGTTLIYNGSFFQTTSAVEFPTANGPVNVTINNTLGVSFPASFNRSLPGRLSLQNGNLAIGDGNILSLTNTTLANQLSYTGGFITTGTLGRYFPTTGLPTSAGTNALFPFGSGANSRFLNLFFSSASLTGGTGGLIFVKHAPLVDATPISLIDNNPTAITLDKRTNTSWSISTSAFNLGSGGTTISLTTIGANVGSVNDYTYLRLTDGVTPNFGTLIATTGSNAIPTVGKSALSQTALNKTIYIGSDSHNPLIIITFTWTGAGGNTNWTTPGNWTGGVGYPSASTEIAIINATSGSQPTINTGSSINVYQLTVGAGMTLAMAPSAGITVYDNVSFNGTALFNPTSTFGYASSSNPQNILNILPSYGNLSLSGTAPKNLPPIITLTGDYMLSGSAPVLGMNTFVYAGTGAQRIAATKYYNLTITGNRGGSTITLGNPPTPGTVDIANTFSVSGLSNYTYPGVTPILSYTTVNFSSPGPQTIPGFHYPRDITDGGNGPRILDNLGSTDSSHVISCRSFLRGTGLYTLTGSKVNYYVTGITSLTYNFTTYHFNDLEISGNLLGNSLGFSDGPFYIGGRFSITLTNYNQLNSTATFVFDGAGDQVITGFKPNPGTNTPGFKYSNLTITGGNRNVTLGAGVADTISITGNLTPETNANGTASPFAAGKGFIVAGSTVNFSGAGSVIPLLKPAVAGGNNYNHIVVSSGTRLINGNMTIGGNLSVRGTDLSVPTTLTIGNGSTPMALNILGNLSVTGTAKIAGKVAGKPDK